MFLTDTWKKSSAKGSFKKNNMGCFLEQSNIDWLTYLSESYNFEMIFYSCSAERDKCRANMLPWKDAVQVSDTTKASLRTKAGHQKN